jgi:hypothetical protein
MARPAKSMQDPALLQAALEGLELQRKRIEEQIAQVRSMLGGKAPKPGSDSAAAPAVKKRQLSPAARKRIAEAQKRRWAEYRKAEKAEG